MQFYETVGIVAGMFILFVISCVREGAKRKRTDR